MIELARLVREALKDGVYGVNAKLTALATDGGDPVPSAFAAANIVESTSDDRAALRRFDAADADWSTLVPALLVSVPKVEWKDAEWATLAPRMDAEVTVQVRCAVDVTDPATAERETVYRLKAVEQSLRAFMLQANRARNNAMANVLLGLQRLVVSVADSDGLVTGMVEARLHVSVLDAT